MLVNTMAKWISAPTKSNENLLASEFLVRAKKSSEPPSPRTMRSIYSAG